MLLHSVKVYPSKINLPKKKQLAWKIAEVASDNAKLNKEAIEMCRVLHKSLYVTVQEREAVGAALRRTIEYGRMRIVEVHKRERDKLAEYEYKMTKVEKENETKQNPSLWRKSCKLVNCWK